MKQVFDNSRGLGRLLNRMNLKLRPKLILIFLVVMIIPIILLTVIAWNQIASLGNLLRDIAVSDSSNALNDMATENIERMTTDTAAAVADFLYQRDADILLLAGMTPSDGTYRVFSENRRSKVTLIGEWIIAGDGMSWIPTNPYIYDGPGGKTTNEENNRNNAFHYRAPDFFPHDDIPLYDEVAFIDINGNEIYKYVTPYSPKKNYPMNPGKHNISDKANTYVRAENYFEELQKLKPGEIYVSDVIGAYVGTNYIGMYTPDVLQHNVPAAHPNADALNETGKLTQKNFLEEAKKHAYAGMENPHGRRFEGIVRWAAPVTDRDGKINGYVTFALNHDHIMEFVDHITPMNERYTELPSAFEGNYAFIWDYQCRSICHPRHHSIVGYDPETGDPEVPWLEDKIYEAWQNSGTAKWTDYIVSWPKFDQQSREKKPAPELTKAGLVGLDGRYLNNAPQCTGWMDLTFSGGSGSFYILWSGIEKLTTAGAIPYYTGQYAPSEANNYSKRGFGIVTIGAGLDDFNRPAHNTQKKLTAAISDNMLNNTLQLIATSLFLFAMVVMIAILLSSYLTDNIRILINGISRFRSGERQFRLNSNIKDEFGTLASSFDEMADSIVDSVNEPLSIIDMNHKVIYMNDYALKVLDKTQDEVIGTSYGDTSLYPPGSKYCPITALRENREAEVLYHEGRGHFFKGIAHYLLNKDGSKIGYIIVSNDVTEIENSRQKAEEASRAKTNFLSNMSHEMRTPMNAIIGMTSIGKAAPDIEKKDYSFRKIEDASTHLLGVINDILDMSKIEANKFALSITEFVFEKMIQRVVDVINFRVDEKHQKLTVHIDPAIPHTLTGDEQRFAQVITNLLTNAVKFTAEEGTIHLEAKLSSGKNGICTILISISDTGIGISYEQQNRLFNPFEQAEASTSRKYGGTGLGLVISKNIIEMMNGSIWVKSEIGKGSTFSFTVNIACGKDEHKRLLSPELNLDNTHILAVDDDPDILSFFKETAKQIGVACDTASGGPEALSLIKKNGPYNIYFIDWAMPEMNGIELAHRINEKGTDNSVIIMISVTDWSVIQDDAREAGVNKYLPKPLFITSIADCINDCLCVPNQSETGTQAVINFAGRCILLAEDVEINREIVLALLEPTHLTIDCAENGLEAVRLFRETPDKYDMIFMDIQMPEMDGYEATRRIRAFEAAHSPQLWESSKGIPIIAMTANVFKEDVEKCLDAGMNSHVGKPLDFEEVLHMLRTFLLNKE
ncbi:MAG: response regulator [Treponema sp.]|nr:response regulator [Treponema sp.]